jgi:hypothetical protein
MNTLFTRILGAVIMTGMCLAPFGAYVPAASAQTQAVSVPTSNWLQDLKELTMDAIVYALINTLIQELTTSVVNWINSGFEGNPSFASLEQNLSDLGEQVVGEFIEGHGLDFICSPFQVDIKLALLQKYKEGGADTPFRRETQCTWSAAKENLEEFVAGDFSKGGWKGWLELSESNPVSIYLKTDQEIQRQLNEKGEAQITKLNWGNGFLSWEKQDCYETTETSPEGVDVKFQECDPPVVQTPGKVIEQQLNNNLDSGRQRLIVADEIDEFVGSVIGALVNYVLQEGLRSTLVDESDGGGLNWDVPELGGENIELKPAGPGGLGYPPTAGQPGRELVFRQPGVFFEALEGNGRREFELPAPEGSYYRRAEIGFDVYIDTLGGEIFNGAVVDLTRPKIRSYFAVWINKLKGKTIVESADNEQFGADRPWREKTNYHIEVVYDAETKKVTFFAANKDTGEPMGAMAGPITNLNIQNEGGGLSVGFGLAKPTAQDANGVYSYYPPYSWKYSDLTVRLVPPAGVN